MKPVRLRAAKPYCGQHPGECVAGPFGFQRPKRTSRYLEWDDWVEFNNLINDVLDARGVEADTWSVPQEPLDKGKNMYVRRRLLGRRLRYEWTEEQGRFGRPARIWNHGDDSQFAPPQHPFVAEVRRLLEPEARAVRHAAIAYTMKRKATNAAQADKEEKALYEAVVAFGAKMGIHQKILSQLIAAAQTSN